MGSWLFDQLKASGLKVSGIDKTGRPELEKFAESCDVLILSIPINAFPEVTGIVGPRVKPGGVLIDTGSLKVAPVNEMLANSVCEVIGAHPMFGPSAESLRGRLFYLCPERASTWLDKITQFLEGQGAQVHVISPEKHDRLMATVQTLRHVILTSIGLTLQETGFDLRADSRIAGEWFQHLTNMMTHQFEQPSELYADLALGNKYSNEVLNSFRARNEEVVNSILSFDKNVLLDLMNRASDYSKKAQRSRNMIE